MSMHDRDWYKEWHREREGYKEKAAFRMPASDVHRVKRVVSWRRLLIRVVSVGFAVYLLARVVTRLVPGWH